MYIVIELDEKNNDVYISTFSGGESLYCKPVSGGKEQFDEMVKRFSEDEKFYVENTGNYCSVSEK